MAEEFDVLEGTGHTHPGDFVGAHPGQVVLPAVVVEQDAAPLGTVPAVDTVEQAGLPRAVGTDDGQDFTLPDFQAHPGQRGHAVEGKEHVFHHQLPLAGLEGAAVEVVAESPLEHDVLPKWACSLKRGALIVAARIGGVKLMIFLSNETVCLVRMKN